MRGLVAIPKLEYLFIFAMNDQKINFIIPLEIMLGDFISGSWADQLLSRSTWTEDGTQVTVCWAGMFSHWQTHRFAYWLAQSLGGFSAQPLDVQRSGNS
jgi:hypothetical protein